MQLAYGVHGSGPPLVKAPNWLTHIEHDWQSPVWRHWLTALGEHCTVIRYDERGCGLSDREVDEHGFEFERWLGDLEAVVETIGPERFTLLGISQGAGIAIAYTVRHPYRVSHLILYGGYLRGSARLDERMRARGELMASAIRIGLGSAGTRHSAVCSRRSSCRRARPSRLPGSRSSSERRHRPRPPRASGPRAWIST